MRLRAMHPPVMRLRAIHRRAMRRRAMHPHRAALNFLRQSRGGRLMASTRPLQRLGRTPWPRGSPWMKVSMVWGFAVGLKAEPSDHL
jgi:hypothetical protein